MNLLKIKGFAFRTRLMNINLETGATEGLLMTDEQCAHHTRRECTNYMGDGCIWEPFNEYCFPKIDMTSFSTLRESCQPIEAHIQADYDVNMIEQEHINIGEYRDRDNKHYPYKTSKYLCDVCHIRDMDLDKLKEYDDTNDTTSNYYLLKEYINFNSGNTIARIPGAT